MSYSVKCNRAKPELMEQRGKFPVPRDIADAGCGHASFRNVSLSRELSSSSSPVLRLPSSGQDGRSQVEVFVPFS